MSPPVGKSWGEWLTDPDVGIRYLAAYVGWSRRELERFTSDTGGWFSQEREWWFIGKMINGDNPTVRVDNLVERSRSEGASGVISYWASSIAPDNKFQTSARYVRYMKSPVP